VLEGRVVVAAAASLFNTALLTADGELYMLGKSVLLLWLGFIEAQQLLHGLVAAWSGC
jgi:hypothetical protein